MSTHSQIQELANNLEIQNSRNKSYVKIKISECTLIIPLINARYSPYLGP